jgi:hypothetical protein
MANLMGGNNDSTETTSVLNDGDTVDLLQPFVDHTRSSHIGKSFQLETKSISSDLQKVSQGQRSFQPPKVKNKLECKVYKFSNF